MRDGVRIAVDLWLPGELPGEPIPTVMRATRYHRAEARTTDAIQDASNFDEAERWNANGYALVIVDARGSGASFGTREFELSADEIVDYGEVIDWIAAQPWSNGRVGSYDVSYDGDTAEMMARLGNPHLAAIGPRFNDYDPYRQLIYPGGAYLERPFGEWLIFGQVLDGIDGALERVAEMYGATPEQVAAEIPAPAPVDGPDGERLLAEAIAEHQGNVRLDELIPASENIDDGPWRDTAVSTYRAEIEASNVPVLIQAGWFDAGTVAGTLERFADFTNTQEVWIGPWDHGGHNVIDPSGSGVVPAADTTGIEQLGRVLAFFNRHVRDGEFPNGTRVIHFTSVGSPEWTTTELWPVPGGSDRVWTIDGEQLVDGPAESDAEIVVPNVAATTGAATRWTTNVAGTSVDYGAWASGATDRLSFATAALESDVHVCGFPIVALALSCSEPDAAVHAYLEQIAPNGTATYLTEGVLRLVHRATAGPVSTGRTVPRTFLADDRIPMAGGEVVDITIDLFPIAAIVPAGHRIQLSVAVRDADNFADYTAAAEVMVHTGPDRASGLTVPTIG